LKVTFESHFHTYTLAQVFTCESQLSEIEQVLFLTVFFLKQSAVIGQSESQNSTVKVVPTKRHF